MALYERSETFTPEERKLLARHVTNLDSNIYCIHNLPPEVIAVLFAYVSRSPNTFRENLVKLLESGELNVAEMAQSAPEAEQDGEGYASAAEKARKFHEKWVVGYGHASVAEHADLKYAFDDVSIHVAKFIEANRLGSYTEKSSRYQVFEANSFIIPDELSAERAEENGDLAPLREEFLSVCYNLFGLYSQSIEPLTALMEERFPLKEGKRERPWRSSISAKVCDVARALLPASTMTSLGVSWNARSAEHAINKLLSHPSEEFKKVGEALLLEGRKICPALLKHVGEKAYFRDTPSRLRNMVAEMFPVGNETPYDAEMALSEPRIEPEVRLTLDDPHAERRLIAALMFEYSTRPWTACWKRAGQLEDEAREALLEAFFNGREKFDYPLRSLEHPVMAMEIECDYGAYRDIQRHRIATLTEQETSCALGYEMGPEWETIGLAREYRAAMDRAAAIESKLRFELPAVAPYVVPQGFRKRILFSWNLRELEHFIRLRSGRQGHWSYRRVAQLCHNLLAEHHPRLSRYFECDHDDYGLGRLAAEERTEAKREAIEAANSVER